MTPPNEVFAALDEKYERIPIDHLVASKTNPRTHFDETYIKQLAESINEKGVLEPILVRPNGKGKGHFEIVAGECRYRASKAVGATHLPAVIRPYTDEQVLEIQLIENLHRNDLRPLEQARGFRALIDSNPTKHSAESIAVRIGMSPAWVWDRMKLLDLVPEAQQILNEDRMTVGHAILIARLKPEDQKRTIAHDDDSSTSYRGIGLWRNETDPANKGKKPGKWDGLKPCSVRELESWINDNVRFDVAHMAKAAPLEFEPLAAMVEERQAQPGRGKKVIAITFDHYVQPEAKDENERTYGPKSFKFADGNEHVDEWPRRKYKAATCEHSVLGVVAAGEQRGTSFDVCIARDKCQVHWKKEIAAKDKNTKLRASGKAGQADKREAAAERKRQKENEERERQAKRWKIFQPALAKAVHAAAAKLKGSKLPAPLFAHLLRYNHLPPTTTIATLANALLEESIRSVFNSYTWHSEEPDLVKWAKLLGVDIKACEPKDKSVQTSGDKAKKSAKGKAA